MAMNYFIIFPAYFPPKMLFNGQSFRCLAGCRVGKPFWQPLPFNTFWRFPIRFRLYESDIVFSGCTLVRITKTFSAFFSTKLRDSLVCFIYVYWSLTFFIRFNWFNGRIRQPDKFTQPNRQRPGRQTVWIFIRNVRRRRRRRWAKSGQKKPFIAHKRLARLVSNLFRDTSE